jgi:hypothetical protein
MRTIDKVIETLEALISDIEAMQSPADGWYGPFSEHTAEWELQSGVAVEWPNLSISLAEAKQALAEHDLKEYQETQTRLARPS